jgi:hypothetical protein
MSTTLTNAMTAKDMTLYIAGRNIGTITECSITGNSALSDVSVIGDNFKKYVRTFKNFSGSWTMWIQDLEALGLVLGEYWIDPTKTETWPTIDYNGVDMDITHVQGTHPTHIEIGATEKVAQKFIAAGATLSATAIKLWDTTYVGDATTTVTIEADTTGSPSGTPLDTDTLDFSSAVAGWRTADLSLATLVKGSTYWIVVAVDSTTRVGVAATDIYPGWGHKVFSGTWGLLVANDLSFYINTTDNSTVLQMELTDGVNTHIFTADIGPGSGSFTINTEEPISAEVSYVAKTVAYSG